MTEEHDLVTVPPNPILVISGRVEPLTQKLADELAAATGAQLVINLRTGWLSALDERAMLHAGWQRVNER